jgi:hypothetical protein
MNRYFAIYHGMHERAPWGVAVERTAGFPKVELLMLCRTEKDATEAANITSLGRGLKKFRDGKVAERAEGGGGKTGKAGTGRMGRTGAALSGSCPRRD